MSVLDQLASSLNRRDEVPNQELAKKIADANDTNAVKELIDNLTNKNKDIQSDCIKALYEIGTLKPKLIAGYINDFVRLLDSKNNRLQWGSMHALNIITTEKPDEVYSVLPQLADIAEKGTVITTDNYVAILISLISIKKYADNVFHLLNEQLLVSPTNQLPMYAENAFLAMPKQHRAVFIKTLITRLPDIEKETKRKRVEKVLSKLQHL